MTTLEEILVSITTVTGIQVNKQYTYQFGRRNVLQTTR